nr:reverse transcriptase domain-containing protein [Tanacetum cinerariifolium]
MHNNSPSGSVRPICLSFDDERGIKEEMDDDEDLRKPYKEVIKLLFSRRIIEFSALNHRTPTNLKIYNGSIDLDDYISRFMGAMNQGEWEMPVCFRKEIRIEKKVLQRSNISLQNHRKADEMLPDFKEHSTKEMSYIPDVLIVMQISAFMSNSKCLELARRFSNQVPKTVTKMMRRVDDFVKSEEAFKSIELPKGEHPKRGQGMQFRGSRHPRTTYRSGPPRVNSYNNNRRDHYQPYVPPRPQDQRFDNHRHENRMYDNRREEVNHLRLDSLTKLPNKILAIELHLQLPPCPPTVASPRKENLDIYSDYHVEKGHYTNDCFHLKRQLEVALESGKLNHLVKDIRQRGNNKGRQSGNNNDKRKTKLVGFSSEQLVPIRKIELEVKFGGGVLTRYTIMKFTVVWVSSMYNIILGRTGIRELRAVSSMRKKDKQKEKEEVKEQEHSGSDEGEKVLVNPAFPDQLVTIGTQFFAECREQLIRLLKNNLDVFAWQPSDMVRVTIRLVKHALNVNNSMPHVSQKRRVLGAEKSRVVTKEFGLKNAGATYQRLVDSAFQAQLGRNLEAYMDDMVIKRKTKRGMIMDITKTFDNLRKISIKLNPKKCSFGVGEGNFLGYMITSEGIRANPKKTKAVADMKSSKTLKDMQSLSRKKSFDENKTSVTIEFTIREILEKAVTNLNSKLTKT